LKGIGVSFGRAVSVKKVRLGELVFHSNLPEATMTTPVVDAIGMTGAVLTTVCWVPQAVRIIRSRETRAISLAGTLAFTIGIVFWLLYGLALVDWPLIASNAVTLGLMSIIVALKLRHG
jgi:MtN3 and saliva related transmembrane protein